MKPSELILANANLTDHSDRADHKAARTFEENAALAHFEVGQVEAGLRWLGIKLDQRHGFHVKMGTVVWAGDHLEWMKKVGADWQVCGL